MKAKILSIVLLMSLSTVLMAQSSENGDKRPMRGQDHGLLMNGGQRGMADGLNLTDEQKAAFKQGMIDMHKQMKPLRNELGEAEAHQKTLVTAEKPDFSAINKNIEKIGAIKIEMAKIQTKQHLDMRALLTDEQKLKFDQFKGKMGHRNGQNGQGGMMHRKGMMRGGDMQPENEMN
jgi:Spy/CpxP family protein refolding chaperone